MKNGTKTLVGISLLTAVVVVLQLMGSFIRFGVFSISLVLIPIVIGAALYGTWAASFLGFAFGVTVLLSGDANPFFAFNVLGTIVTVIVKGTLCGFATAVTYKATKKTIIASIVCPIVNTGVFLIGCYAFFMPLIQEWANGADVAKYMLVGFVGGNFVFELLFNIIISPTIVRIISIRQKK